MFGFEHIKGPERDLYFFGKNSHSLCCSEQVEKGVSLQASNNVNHHLHDCFEPILSF
jgi:hypothetical protein